MLSWLILLSMAPGVSLMSGRSPANARLEPATSIRMRLSICLGFMGLIAIFNDKKFC